MPWQITLYIVISLIAAAINLLLAVFAWRHRDAPGARSFTILLLLIVLWSVFAVLEVLSFSLRLEQFWYNFKAFSLAFSPVLLFIFVVQYLGWGRWLTWPRLLLLCLIPTLTQFFAWTNLFDLWWRDGITSGPWFWVHATYAFILIFVAMILMLLRLLRATEQRWQLL